MASSDVDPDQYEQAPPELLDLVLFESDKRIAAQVQLMIAADQRAGGILTACVTLAAGGGGFAIAQLKAGDPLTPFFWLALSFSITEAVGGLLALAALWPEPIDPPGFGPAVFSTDLGKQKRRVQAEIASFLQGRIDTNRQRARKLSGRIQGAMLFAAMGPIVGLGVGLGLSEYSWIGVGVCGSAATLFIVLGCSLLPDPMTTFAAKTRRMLGD